MLKVQKQDLDKLHQHAEGALPKEAVALLFGSVYEDTVTIDRVELVENILDSSTSFAVDPMTQYELLMDADKRGQELVCIFHSHPSGSSPSSRDRENMNLNPVIWLIASKEKETWESHAFILEGDHIRLVEVRLV
jgi:proteasome lid subunit RPN8/RPN11